LRGRMLLGQRESLGRILCWGGAEAEPLSGRLGSEESISETDLRVSFFLFCGVEDE